MFSNLYQISSVHKNTYLSNINITLDKPSSNTNDKKIIEMINKLNDEHDDYINKIKQDIKKKK